ncbi:MAG: hypothetical protein U0132_12910 [Gemmatimonadaceae bacterium]
MSNVAAGAADALTFDPNMEVAMRPMVDPVQPRRGFLARLTGAIAAVAAGSATTPRSAFAESPVVADDRWLQAIHGDHRQYFDAVSVAGGFPLVYALSWANTMKATYNLTNDQLCAVIGLRHMGIAPAFNDAIWEKYKLGQFFKVDDPKTKQPSTRNIFNSTAPGDLRFPGSDVGSQMKNGAVVVACNLATTVLSGIAANAAGLSMAPEAAYKEWAAGLVPGVMLVPSGVLAVHRAQAVGKCTYCAAVE